MASEPAGGEERRHLHPEPIIEDVTSQDRLLKACEVQRLLNLSRANVYRLMKAEVLPTVRIRGAVRVPYRDLVRWIESHTKPGAGPAD